MNLQTYVPIAPADPMYAQRQSGKRAIIVDDYPGITLLIAPCLRDLGYQVLEATNGRQAQDMIAGLGPTGLDLLITDLDLPEMGGDELARWFRREYPDVRVLVMSADQSASELGRDVMFLKKPFSLASLAARLGELAETQDQTNGTNSADAPAVRP